jgi:hypothetical protein
MTLKKVDMVILLGIFLKDYQLMWKPEFAEGHKSLY